jgi:hypothetical protein
LCHRSHLNLNKIDHRSYGATLWSPILVKLALPICARSASYHHHPSNFLLAMLPIATKTKRKATASLHPFGTLDSIRELFTFSPFGLCCRQSYDCRTIEFDERCICRHLKKHGMDSRVATVRSLLDGYKRDLENAKALGSIESFRSNYKTYYGYSVFVVGLFSR